MTPTTTPWLVVTLRSASSVSRPVAPPGRRRAGSGLSRPWKQEAGPCGQLAVTAVGGALCLRDRRRRRVPGKSPVARRFGSAGHPATRYGAGADLERAPRKPSWRWRQSGRPAGRARAGAPSAPGTSRRGAVERADHHAAEPGGRRFMGTGGGACLSGQLASALPMPAALPLEGVRLRSCSTERSWASTLEPITAGSPSWPAGARQPPSAAA